MMEATSRAIAYAPSAGFPVGVGLSVSGDERLAKLVADGNDRAFAVLFERYHQPLYRYCRSILRHDGDAQDALQSAFAGALVALRRGQRDAPLRPWLFRIAHNESISLVRRRRGAGHELTDDMAPVVASAEEHAQERERMGLLLADLQELPERQRGALVMRELSGLSHEEIAAALGTSPGTAKQAIFEARTALLEFAEGRAMRCEEICRTISDGDRRALRARRVRAHLRDCGACASFAAAIPARRAELHALAAPIAPLAAAGVLARLTGGGVASTGVGGGAGGGAVGTVTAKLATAGLTGKALVTAVVVTGTAAGVTGALTHVRHLLAPAASQSASATPAAGRAGAEHLRGRMFSDGVRSDVVLRSGSHEILLRPGSRAIVLKRGGGQRTATHGQANRHNMSANGSAGRATSAHGPNLGQSATASQHGRSGGAQSQGQGNSAGQSQGQGNSAGQSQGQGSSGQGDGAAGSQGSNGQGSQHSTGAGGQSTTSGQASANGSGSSHSPAGLASHGSAGSTTAAGGAAVKAGQAGLGHPASGSKSAQSSSASKPLAPAASLKPKG